MPTSLLTDETRAKVLEALAMRHGRMLRDERFAVAARLENGSVIVTLDLASLDRTFHYRMEAAKAVPEDGTLTAPDTLDLCLDFLDWYLGLYFADDREVLLPLDWQPHRFGEVEVLARGDVTNPILEEAADAWLRGERVEVELPRRRR